MAPLIAMAVSAASKFIPELIGSALDSEKAESVARVVTDSAMTYAGIKDPEQALKKVQEDKQFWEAQRSKIVDIVKMELADIQHAREHVNDDVTKRLSYMVMVCNPVFIGLCVWALIWVSTSTLDSGLITAISAVLGGAINNFFQERQQVMNFRFGSSLGSKIKALQNTGLKGGH